MQAVTNGIERIEGLPFVDLSSRDDSLSLNPPAPTGLSSQPDSMVAANHADHPVNPDGICARLRSMFRHMPKSPCDLLSWVLGKKEEDLEELPRDGNSPRIEIEESRSDPLENLTQEEADMVRENESRVLNTFQYDGKEKRLHE